MFLESALDFWLFDPILNQIWEKNIFSSKGPAQEGLPPSTQILLRPDHNKILKQYKHWATDQIKLLRIYEWSIIIYKSKYAWLSLENCPDIV